jgi:multimeric flavodoxin WrbA
MRHIVLLGSSNSSGNTRKVVDRVIEGHNIPIIDLKTLNISYFDYEHKNRDDDFLPLIREIVKYETLILATPIYWYSMSAIMKTFVDRLTDLLTIEKDLGRQLRNKKMYLLSSFNSAHKPCFEEPLCATSSYMGMIYLGGSFIQLNPNHNHDLDEKNKVEIEKARTLLGLT